MTSLNVFAAVLNSTGEFAYGKVCNTCTYAIANGEPSFEDKRDQAVVEKNCETYDFTLGHQHVGPWPAMNCFHQGSECEDDCECERTDFAKDQPCDMCGDHLDGYRHDVIMVKRELLSSTMTQEQFDKLSVLCERFHVSMAITDYFVYSQDSSMMPGYAEGWVGGPNHNGGLIDKHKTIYVGVEPNGDSHS